jgi:hypothetical protein
MGFLFHFVPSCKHLIWLRSQGFLAKKRLEMTGVGILLNFIHSSNPQLSFRPTGEIPMTSMINNLDNAGYSLSQSRVSQTAVFGGDMVGINLNNHGQIITLTC